ncbi:tRNA (adenosine(37)-N6)-dimethylallyltransferase MiaA [Salegentibacter sp. HM20]
MAEKTLISVVGPTAIGKTSLAIKLALHFDTEIISADSRQFYREMSIGTAVPSEEELATAQHHFIQHISIEDDYSVGDFERETLIKLSRLFAEKDVVVMAGGSGLYIKSITEGLDDFPAVAPEVREELNNIFQIQGIESLQELLEKLDPEYYKKVDRENPHRLIRALEICVGTGKTYSSFLKQAKKSRNFKVVSVGLEAERKIIYDRINTRVDLMMDEGLLDEVKSLEDKKQLNALNTVGYKELFAFLEGKHSLETAVSEIKKNTRRFAKRQLTWFRKDKSILWFDYTRPTEEIIQKIEEQLD